MPLVYTRVLGDLGWEVTDAKNAKIADLNWRIVAKKPVV